MSSAARWRVLRVDDNGFSAVLAEVDSEARARALVAEYEARGHKQHYWCEEARAERTSAAADGLWTAPLEPSSPLGKRPRRPAFSG